MLFGGSTWLPKGDWRSALYTKPHAAYLLLAYMAPCITWSGFVALKSLSTSSFLSLVLSQRQEVPFLQTLFMLCTFLPYRVNTGCLLCPPWLILILSKACYPTTLGFPRAIAPAYPRSIPSQPTVLIFSLLTVYYFLCLWFPISSPLENEFREGRVLCLLHSQTHFQCSAQGGTSEDAC